MDLIQSFQFSILRIGGELKRWIAPVLDQATPADVGLTMMESSKERAYCGVGRFKILTALSDEKQFQ